MKNCCLVLLTLLPLTAFAYPTELQKQMNGAEVSATIQEIDNNIGGLTLYNYGEANAKCSAVFRNGPEAPRTRVAELKAGESTNLTARFGRSIIKLRVDVTCEPK
ncbi:3-phosphoglycerate kinase [Aquipseudomonas alcaligenes]|uniref:3-phosphoglycerate kinase n=1 Tax=Aquipseudomonas alcaligenes TaxID=43263 RepID=UPI00374A05BA